MRKPKLGRNLYWRGDTIHYRFKAKGQDYHGSFETSDPSEAQSRLNVIKRELIATHFGEKPRRTFNETVIRFQEDHFRHLRPSTRRRYVASIANLFEKLDGLQLNDIRSGILSEFEAERWEDGVAASTIIHDLRTLSVMMTRAEEWEWVDKNTVKPFIRARALTGLVAGPPRIRYLDHTEEAGVLAVASERIYDRVVWAIDTGMRKEEQFSLLRSDVDLGRNEVTVRAEIAKSGKARRIPLLPRARDVFERLRKDIRSPYLFMTEAGHRYSPNSPTIGDTLEAAYNRAVKLGHIPAGKEAPNWHDLRRTCGCRLLQDRKMSMEEVCHWLGHSSVTVTEKHYAFLRVDELHRAVERSEATVLPFKRA